MYNNEDALIGLFGTVGGLIFFFIYSIIIIAINVVLIIGIWKTFVKAGRNGWESIIPVYNFWVLAETSCNNNILYFVFLFIPFLNFVSIFAISIGISKCFGKGIGFGIFTAFFPFIGFPVLGMGKAQYDETCKL